MLGVLQVSVDLHMSEQLHACERYIYIYIYIYIHI